MKDYREIFFAKYTACSRLSLGDRGYDAAGYEFADRRFIPLIQEWCRPLDRTQPCIDLGCGDGSLLHTLGTLGFRNLHGVDVSGEQVEIARKITPGVVVGDLCAYLNTFPDDHFCLITLFDVIEHFTKDEIVECVSLIHRKLKPGGVWICHLPNGDSPFVGSVQFGDFTHETILGPRSAENICILFGFAGFEASEHFGASEGLRGRLRTLAWQFLRAVLMLWNLVETGVVGSRVYTRNFAFKAVKTTPRE